MELSVRNSTVLNVPFGEKFNDLTVLSHAGKNQHGVSLWLVKCRCGIEKILSSNSVRTGNTKSCGCAKKATKVQVGDKYNKLFVVERVDSTKSRDSRWLCVCDCGNYTEVNGKFLRKGEIKSCGICTKRKVSVGDKYGNWEVVSYSHSKKVKDGSLVYWNCKCRCGYERKIVSTRLLSGSTKGCKACSIVDRFGPTENRKPRDYPIAFSDYLKSKIRKRDQHTCQWCKTVPKRGKLDVHHIDHDRHHNDPLNLISLCETCHYRMHCKDADDWIPYWKNFMFEKFDS